MFSPLSERLSILRKEPIFSIKSDFYRLAAATRQARATLPSSAFLFNDAGGAPG